jgi:Nif-specific regulatory protein
LSGKPPRAATAPLADARRLSDLLEISQSLGSSLNLRASLTHVLERLAETQGLVSAAVFLKDESGTALRLEAGTGHAATARHTSLRVGEGITGQVVHTGRPIVVPRVSREPLFLDRSGVFKRSGQAELSYICVPVRSAGRTIGALGVALAFVQHRHYEPETKFYGVVASMVGQAERTHRLIEADRRRLVDENTKLKLELRERYDLHNIVGGSRPMQHVYEQVAQVAPSATTVLVRGESGTGKELIARAIHYHSPRAKKPFVAVSCGALPESLIESELFGYEPGAFTDAKRQKQGRFELAHGGTLFLDEIGELSLSTQVRLLRVLQEREFERLGGTHPVKVNVRLIAATNKDLEEAVRKGTFREDLYYRLNVFGLYVPPLRERKPDIPLLADHFVQKYAAAQGVEVRRIATSAIDMLMSYHWPGNVRELENCIERAVLVCEGGVMHAHHLPPSLQTAEVSNTMPRRSLGDALALYEKDLVLDALKAARGNCARAARLLDTTERIVGYAVRKHGIDPKRFR